MAKSVHVRDEELIRALEEGAEYLIAGPRRYLLVQVDDSNGMAPHSVTDVEEVAIICEARNDTSPRLSGDDAKAYLKARLKEHGIG